VASNLKTETYRYELRSKIISILFRGEIFREHTSQHG